MIEKIICNDINLEVTTGICIMIDIFKFTKTKDSSYIEIEIEENGDYKYLDEIIDEYEIETHDELRKEAIKWIFEKVEIA